MHATTHIQSRKKIESTKGITIDIYFSLLYKVGQEALLVNQNYMAHTWFY